MRLRGGIVSALACAAVATAHASPTIKNLDNGQPDSAGHVGIQIDEYGSFGTALAQGNHDKFAPVGQPLLEVTNLGGVIVKLTTNDGTTQLEGTAVLSEDPGWANAVNAANAISGTLGLSRGITTPLTDSGDPQFPGRSFTSQVQLTAPNGLNVIFNIIQRIEFDPATQTTKFDQNINVNNITDPALGMDVNVNVLVVWDADLIWDGDSSNELVGQRDGCYIYQRDAIAPDMAVTMGVAGVTHQDFNGFFAGQIGVAVPSPTASLATLFAVGELSTWSDKVAGSDLFQMPPVESSAGGNGVLVLEYNNNFVAGGGQQGFLTVRRTYGTSTVPCQPSKDCGDGNLVQADNVTPDVGEVCDPGLTDNDICNAGTCQMNACGDGYVNSVREECESNGVDTPFCNGAGGAARCLRPTCGDTHVNAPAGEQCDDGTAETATCNGPGAIKNDGSMELVECRAAVCGDHYTNMMAGEECDTGGIDTGECNGNFAAGGNCKRSRCGDGYVNTEAGEICDGEDCVTCSEFKLGGGCGGCATKNPEGAWILGFAVGAFTLRRRRYNSRRYS